MTSTRFIRDFELLIQVRGGQVKVAPPMQIAFSADKSIRGGLNKANIQVYNLPEKNRLALVKDAEQQKRIPMQLSVGYKGSLHNVFKGTVHIGRNERQGADIVTTMESLDGGFDFNTSFTNATVEGGKRAVDTVLADMTGTTEGKITERPVLSRPKVLVGNSAKLIDDMVGPDETWYIENEQLYIVKDNEVTSRLIPVVSAETGLISTPTREFVQVTLETLMNPSVKIGGRVSLISSTAPHLNGIYKVETINYKGDNYGDDWSQTCTCVPAAGMIAI